MEGLGFGATTRGGTIATCLASGMGTDELGPNLSSSFVIEQVMVELAFGKLLSSDLTCTF